MVEYTQPGAAAQWQDQEKRHCHPGSLGNDNTQTHMQMQMPLDLPPDMASLLPNAELEPAALVAPSMNLFRLPETRGPLGRNDGSGASPVNLQASINSWANCSLQPAAFPAPLSGTSNTPEDLWSSQQSSEILDMSLECLETESMVYARNHVRDDLAHYPEGSEMSLTNLNLPTFDFLGASKLIGLWNQPSELVSDMPLTSVGFPGVGSPYFLTGSGFWRLPDQLHTQTPQLQLCPPGVELFNWRDLPKSNVPLNQDSVLHGNLLHDTTIQIEDHSTESKTSGADFVQSQQLDSFEGNPTPSSMNGKCSRRSYEYSQNAAALDNATARLLHDSKYPSHPESGLSTQFENDTLYNGLAEDCSPFRTQVPQNHGTLDNTVSDQCEETGDVEYDTCFGTVSLPNSNSITQEYYS